MEDYDKFVQHRLSQLSKREEERRNKPSTASSLICFYGRAILPPLLSGEQKEEMQRHRDAAQEAVDRRTLKKDTRMAFVQTMLHSVQVRKTPTLEELLQEPEIFTKSSQSTFVEGTMDNVSLLPPPVENVKDSVTLPPLTSTTYSAFLPNAASSQNHHNGCLVEQHSSQPGSLNSVSYQSESSGYLTHQKDLGSESHEFFIHNTSNTIAKMPDIISYPPIDGEELERSGLESSFSNCMKVQDISCTLFKEYVRNCTGDEETLPLTIVLELEKEQYKPGATDVSDNRPEITSTLSSRHGPKTELHVQHETKEMKPAHRHIEEAEPSEEPYRLSLQALLTKSQEYRRCQRLLRNQAINTKIQEKTQELEAEEQSHSDKENNEFLCKGTVIAKEMRSKDKRCTFRPTIKISMKNSWEQERVNESEFVGKNINTKSDSMSSTGGEQTNEVPSVEAEVVFNNKLNSSREGPKRFSAFLQQPPISKDTSLVQEAFYLTSSPTTSYKGARKYHSLPVPNLCRSPVHYKSRGKDGEAADEADRQKALGKSGFREDHKIGKASGLGHQNIHTALASPASVIVEGSEMIRMDLAMSSQHIDQLESTLSSLKVLISDLESTVKENLENHSQSENNTQKGKGSESETVGKDQDSTHTSSLNQSYDVETPSKLWHLDQSGSDLGSKDLVAQENQLTPKSEGESQGSASKVKRRLLLSGTQERSPDASGGANSGIRANIPRAPFQVFGGCGSQKDRQEQLKQVHAAQIRALQDEHRRQQQELLQALSARYSLLQRMSFPCSMPASRLGDTLTFSTLSQLSSTASECYRPLLSAAVKGFLTRRLLRTARVAQLVRTVRDTQQFLQAFQQQSLNSKQDHLLQERVTLQLRAARYEVHDIFFNLSARERMQLISWDRELARERQLRQQSEHTGQPKGRNSLSTATQKSLERKRGILMEKKAAEKHRGVVTRTGQRTGFTAEQPLKTKRGQFRANPQRVCKSSYSARPR